MADAPSVRTWIWSTADSGIKFKSTPPVPPLAALGLAAMRLPLNSTRVSTLRSATAEAPLLVPPAMFAFSTPMLFAPWICGTVLRSTSSTLVLTPLISIAAASMIWTGRAFCSSSVAGISEPVTTNLSSLTVSSFFSSVAGDWAKAALAANSESPTPSSAKGFRRLLTELLFIVRLCVVLVGNYPSPANFLR